MLRTARLHCKGMNMKSTKIFEGCRAWAWFILLSLLAGLLAALLSGSLQIGQSVRAGAPLEEFRAHMEERIPALMKLYRIPGCSVALVRNNEIIWTQGFGHADVASGRALTADTPMRVQSISKSVTAWGVMKLAQDGLIDLDASVSQYLASWHFPPSDYSAQKVTVRRLLSHTAGMPLGDILRVYAPGEKMPSLREKLTQEAVLTQEPGLGFSYSNTGYNLLELLIEEVTGRDFSEYMRSEVLLPLGMGSACFAVDDAMAPYPPTGYGLDGKAVPVYVYPEKASGGLFSTAGDIARFAVAEMRGNPVLSAESVGQMHTPESGKLGVYGLVFDAYGLGHYIETLPNGMCSVSHGGQGTGIMTHFQAVPETGDAIVLLTNSQRSWPFIAYLLGDWARWRGFQSVGMGKIIWGHYALSAAVGMLLCASLLAVVKPMAAPCRQSSVAKLLRTVTALLLLGILIWCACQRYLFITSVFPVLSIWLGGAALALSIALLSSALLPLRAGKKEDMPCESRK